MALCAGYMVTCHYIFFFFYYHHIMVSIRQSKRKMMCHVTATSPHFYLFFSTLSLWPAWSCGRWLNSITGMTWAWAMKRWRAYTYQQNQACRPGKSTPTCTSVTHRHRAPSLSHQRSNGLSVCLSVCLQPDGEAWWRWWSREAGSDPVPSPPRRGAWALRDLHAPRGGLAFLYRLAELCQWGIKN